MSFIYSQAAAVLRSIIVNKSGLKSACFASYSNSKAVYALVKKVLPLFRMLQRQLLKAKISQIYKSAIMLYDYKTKGKISGGGLLKQKIIQAFKGSEGFQETPSEKIWVRVNGFKDFPAKIPGEKDDLIENLYFTQKTRNISKLLSSFQLIGQSKSSCMPVASLKISKGHWNAIDTCAAPGNKTIQLAEMMKKTTSGVLFAYEKDPKRFKTLKSRVKSAGASNVIVANQDFFNVKKFDNVKIAVVDPSCSGSGIVEHQLADFGRIHYDYLYTDARVDKLSAFQSKILEKTLKIPGIEQVVYSTCSIYVKENEEVVRNLMERHWRKFRLAKVLEKWENRGIGPYGKYMARQIPSKTSQGFFVARFARRKTRLRHKFLRKQSKYWALRRVPIYT